MFKKFRSMIQHIGNLRLKQKMDAILRLQFMVHTIVLKYGLFVASAMTH